MISDEFVDYITNIKEDSFSVTDMLEFNRLMAILPTKENNEQEYHLFKNFADIEDNIKKIRKNSFGWDQGKADKMKHFFMNFRQLKGLIYMEFCNCEFLTQKLPIEYFKLYAGVNYGRVGGTPVYDSIIRVATFMLEFFNNSIFLKDYVFMTKLPSKSCFLFDPIFRQRVREVNRTHSALNEKYFNAKFNLKEFAFLCIDKYFPNVGWRWTGFNHLAHVETLKLVVNMFEYGLWDVQDLDPILTNLYAMSEVMHNLENYLYNDRDRVRQANYFTQQIKGCADARELIASCFLHIILLYLDEDVNEKLLNFNIDTDFNLRGPFKSADYDPNKVKDLFKHSTFKKNKLYTYFSYILVTYLGRFKFIKDGFDTVRSDSLSHMLGVLFNYISDINGDFYKISLKMLKPQYFPFYFLEQENEYAQKAISYKAQLESLVDDIKNQTYGQLNSDYGHFLARIKDVFKEIELTLRSNRDNASEVSSVITKKLVLSLYNIPHYILAFLHLINEVDVESDATKQVFREGLNLIRKIGIENYPGFNQMFTGYNFKHMESLYAIKMNEMNVISRELVIRSETLPLVEHNPDILQMNLKIYKELIASFVDSYRRTGAERNFSEMNYKVILSLYKYNDILNTLIESFTYKRSKYELHLAALLVDIIPLVFELFAAEDVSADNQRYYDFWKGLQKESTAFIEQINNWDIIENNMKRMFILELFRTFLVVFNRATNRFYTRHMLGVVSSLFEGDYTLPTFFKYFNCEIGISVVNQMTRLYTNFMVFRQNHLLDQRFDEFGDQETQTTEITLPDYLMEKEVVEELLGLKSGSLAYVERFGMNHDARKFYFCSYLPLLFKYYSGMLASFIYEDHGNKKKNFEKVLDMLNEMSDLVTSIDSAMKGSTDLELEERIPHKYKKTQAVDDYLNRFVELFDENNSEYFYDEAMRDSIYKKRKKGYVFLKSVLKLYNHFRRRKVHLEKYIRHDPFNTHRKMAQVMRKKLRFSYLYRKNNNLYAHEQDEASSDYSMSEPAAIIKRVDKLYDATKTYFFEFPEHNQCFKVLKTSDILKNNIEYYISYFFNEMYKMDLSFGDLKNNLFTNASFTSLILMMDNLIKISDEYRSTFYKFVTDEIKSEIDPKIKEEVMRKIWDLHKMLYYLTLYKTFFDRDWAEIFTLYYLVSNFIQNLCEDNFIRFKLWFHENKMLKDEGKSLFLSYFSMFEAAFHNSKVHKNKAPMLMLSDKPEIFCVLNRLTVGMTEFINGGAVKTQFEVYKYKIEVWVGIILRIIDDVDSQFYELKENILTFILGLTEGYDFDIINFLAINFPITRLYELIYRLTKKLFVRQMMLKDGISKETEPSPLNFYCYHISEEEESLYQIKGTDSLLDFYKKYETSFSDHVILGVVIKAYTLMRDLSTRVVRYENFIIEKRQDIKAHIRNGKPSPENLEPLYVWDFLNKIIVDIEISYKDANLTREAESSLRIFYFKKLPQSFFLTEDAKTEFRSRVAIDNLDEKHRQFFNEGTQYNIITGDLQRLYCKSKTLFYLSTEGSFYIFMVVLYAVALALNLIMLIFYDEEDDNFSNHRGNMKAARVVLSVILIVLSFLFTVFWFAVKYNTVRKINWEKYYLTRPKEHKPLLWDRFIIDVYESVIRVGVIQTFIFHLVFSILGLAVNAFFYTLSLLLIIHLSLLVYNVALSFMNNYDKLFFTFMILLVVINSFSYLAAQYFRGDFFDEEVGPEYESVCTSYFSCFVNSFNIGLRGGGGLAEYFEFESDGSSDLYIGRFFFDLIFFIMVNIILLGIFFGIIVDSFKELRDEMNKRKNDEEDVCFTCGLSRATFERKGLNFEKHLKIHDIWNYLFYIQYLENKPVNDYDGIDIYVHNLVEQDFNTSWLPIGQSLELERVNKK